MKSNSGKKSVYKNKRWHLLLVRNDGRTVPAGYIKGVMWAVISLVIALLVVMGVIGFLYRGLLDRNTALERTVISQKEELAVATGKKDRLLAELAIAQSQLKLSNADTEKTTAEVEAEVQEEPAENPKPRTAAINDAPLKKAVPQDTAQPGSIDSSTQAAVVSVDNLSVCHDVDSGMMQVEFKVINTGEKRQPVSGHAFTVFKDENEAADQWLVFPETRLIDGEPVPTKGLRFRIYNFRTMKFTVRHSEPAHYTDATIFVYEDTGELLLERNFVISVMPPCP